MNTDAKVANEEVSKKALPAKTVHILLTQCLQNGFFLSEDNRLSLPKEEVYRMLIGNQSESDSSVVSNPYGDEGRVNRHTLKGKYKEGPLYRFLEAVIDKENRQSDLHVIHLSLCFAVVVQPLNKGR